MIGKILGILFLIFLIGAGVLLFWLSSKVPDISMLGKYPEKLKDFIEDLPFRWDDPILKEQTANNPESATSSPQVLGRPKKIVEFYCTTDEQCKTYFNADNAYCQKSTGICYKV